MAKTDYRVTPIFVHPELAGDARAAATMIDYHTWLAAALKRRKQATWWLRVSPGQELKTWWRAWIADLDTNIEFAYLRLQQLGGWQHD